MALVGVDVDVVVEVVGEVDVEGVLFVEGHPVAHFDEEGGWVVVAAGV